MTTLLGAFYGDDFTGSAENLAQYARHGLKCRLYFSAEDGDEIVTSSEKLDVIGIAGTARALPPDLMEEELRPAFSTLKRLNPFILQYKICSTFDSSPTVGNLGRVMSLARETWPNCVLPVFPATPAFGRYTAFSTHFVRNNNDIARLDRHPGMANHPSTPMREGDLRVHLAQQTDLTPGALMIPDYAALDRGRRKLRTEMERDGYVVLDAVDDEQICHVATLIHEIASERTTFSVAAQGLADGLGRLWRKQYSSETVKVDTRFSGVSRLLVLSGSCAPQTLRQLEVLQTQGGQVVYLPPADVLHDSERAVEQAVYEVKRAFGKCDLVAVTTTRNRSDVGQTEDYKELASSIGSVFAQVASILRSELNLKRIVFGGGDTSSYAMRRIGARALTIRVFDEQWNGHICELFAATSNPIHGMEVVLKGGQVGGDNFFSRVKAGTM